jgi:5-methylcytosine-specific restriction protein A
MPRCCINCYSYHNYNYNYYCYQVLFLPRLQGSVIRIEKLIQIARHKFELGSISYVSFFGSPSSPSYDKKKYEHLTLAIRQTVLERAHNRCQKCSVKFSPRTQPQFEHINGSLKDNRPVNLRALCSECFKSVEDKEKNKKGIFARMRNMVG